MAPTISPSGASGQHLNAIISRSLSSSVKTLSSRATSSKKTPLASLFALIIRGTINLSKRTLTDAVLTPHSSVSQAIHPVLIPASPLSKRQNAILAIPTTYAGLNSGPAPGALVGIVLGSIAGFILILYIFLSAFRLSGYGSNRETVVEEDVVRHRRRSPRRSRSRSRAMTEASGPRRERVVEERVVVEEDVAPSAEEDIVEVIEEHSPERPARKPSGRSGYRTVDPAEFGGGNRPMRKVSRR
ncbi:hypothetical protein A1O1_04871 [Capronia coronata CBS 617.96]|uniref:Uncharacterized protein n=1 Tax=Capronia coronata CBS 617.96 TaxID=1182541 RepID=W9Z091_9EURO|nr:uncharacterized protein A1O1_04871 [Capronia coronata CBS 617.96]EXJ87944.1 hypothetical protein A1O1_04871 [Capronia coronata CBS 617.96]